MLDPDNADEMAALHESLTSARENGYANGRASRLPLVAAAKAVLDYARLDAMLDRAGNDADAFGIRIRDLRALRDALRS